MKSDPITLLNKTTHGIKKLSKQMSKKKQMLLMDMDRDYYFLPFKSWNEIANENQYFSHISDTDRFNIILNLMVLGTWALSKNVYKFTKELQDEVSKSKIIGVIPVDILLRMNDWSSYIELTDFNLFNVDCYGFYVCFDYNNVQSTPELIFVFNLETGLLPFSLLLKQGKTVQESIQELMCYFNINHDTELCLSIIQEIEKIFSFVLYLCSDTPEISDIKQRKTIQNKRVKLKTTKKGSKIFFADKVTNITVGEEYSSLVLENKKHNSKTGSKVRPHLRCAHWHGYWIGGEFTLKWIKPTFIGRKI